MKNIASKLLLSLSGVAMFASGALGIKYQKDSQEMENLQKDLKNSLALAGQVQTMIDLQNRMETERLESIKKVGGAVMGTKTETKTETMVIPGKTVSQTTAAKETSSSKTSSAKSSTSTSTKSASVSTSGVSTAKPAASAVVAAPKPAPAPKPAATTKTS